MKQDFSLSGKILHWLCTVWIRYKIAHMFCTLHYSLTSVPCSMGKMAMAVSLIVPSSLPIEGSQTAYKL